MFFFFNDTATTEIYTLSLHDALPIYFAARFAERARRITVGDPLDEATLIGPMISQNHLAKVRSYISAGTNEGATLRSEEHTSELQSQSNLVCRLLLEKKKRKEDQDSS